MEVYVINNVSELSLDELKKLEESGTIKTIGIKQPTALIGYAEYTIKEYEQCYKELQELVSGIKKEWPNAKKSIYVYRRISKKIKNDPEFSERDSNNEQDRIEYFDTKKFECACCLLCITTGVGICQGFANTYYNALSLVDVEARVVGGKYLKGSGHAWNEVKMDSEDWISQDLTWEQNGSMDFAGGDNMEFDLLHSLCESDRKNHLRSHFVSFDWTAFINSEFGIENNYKYNVRQQERYLDIREKIDMGEISFEDGRKAVLQDIERTRDGFCETIGLAYQQLYDMGLNEEDIAKISGEEAPTREIVRRAITEKKKILEFENEVGFTRKELIDLGLDGLKIKELMYKFDGKTGDILNRKKRVIQAIVNRKDENQVIESDLRDIYFNYIIRGNIIPHRDFFKRLFISLTR